MRVVDEVSVGGNVCEFHFDAGPSLMVEEIRPETSAPYWLAPVDATIEQKQAIKAYSHLEVKDGRS